MKTEESLWEWEEEQELTTEEINLLKTRNWDKEVCVFEEEETFYFRECWEEAERKSAATGLVFLAMSDLTVLGRKQAFALGKPFYKEFAAPGIYIKEYPDGKRRDIVYRKWVEEESGATALEKFIKALQTREG